jgi:hypothetical protein
VIALFMLIALFALVLINVPIAVALGVIAAVAMVAKSGMDNLLNVAVVMFEGATKFPLIAIPLFVLAGAIPRSRGDSRRASGTSCAPAPGRRAPPGRSATRAILA